MRTDTDRQLARLDPEYRIAELERENAILRCQHGRLIEALTVEQAANGFALELLGRGIRAPKGVRFTDNGRLDD